MRGTRRWIPPLVYQQRDPPPWAGGGGGKPDNGSPAQGDQGLQPGAPIGDNAEIFFSDQVAAKIKEAGAGWVRLNFRLGGFDNWTETDSFGFSALELYDEVIANATNNNLKVLGLLSNEAWHGNRGDWQANNAEIDGGTGDNTYIQEFSQNAAVVLASHFAGTIDEWEVWNEPDAPPTHMYPSNFAQLLARVYTEVKASGVTSARLVSGGLFSHQDFTTGAITSESTGADYLRAVYTAGRDYADWEGIKATHGTYPLDDIGQHIYIDPGTQTKRTRMADALQFVHDAYVTEEGADTKTIHVQEVGWQTTDVSERVQAKNLETAYDVFESTDYVTRAYWFFLQDVPAADLYFGLLRSDFSEKPAFESYQKAATY